MSKAKTTRQALVSSVIALALCFAMLLGTTYAWFTDSVSSMGNKIIAGTLDIGLYQWTDTSVSAEITDTSAPIFGSSSSAIAQNNNADTLWEPGKTQIAYLSLKNQGSLYLKYTVRLVVTNVAKDLYEAMEYQIVPNATYGTLESLSWATLGGLGAVSFAGVTIEDGATATVATSSNNVKMAPGAEHFFALAIHMNEEAGNEYQAGEVDFDIQVIASQYTAESDSFNNQYDANATDGVATATATYSTSEDTFLQTGNLERAGNASITIPAGEAQLVDGTPLADDEDVNLKVEKTETPANFTVIDDTNGTTTYEVSLETDSGAAVVSTGEAFLVNLTIGVVDLQSFSHNGVAMTPVASVDDVVDGSYYYDHATGVVTFMTTSFSPFTSEYKFAGGVGTEEFPYLIEDYEQLCNINVGIDDRYAADGTDKVFYRLINDIDVAAHDTTSWAHADLYRDPRTFAIDLDGYTLSLGSKYLYGYARNLEMYNGVISFSGVGTAVVGYACYQDVDSYVINFHDLTLTGTMTNNGAAHFGPLVAYAFSNAGYGYRANDTAAFIADNVVSNVFIASSNSNGYVGGLFGYLEGPNVTASVTNCAFNGSISASFASGFVNSCSAPKAGVTASGNTVNGTLFSTKGATAFGCNGNITGGASALAALNGGVELGENAQLVKLAASTTLVTIDDNNQVIVNDVNASSYRAAIFFSVGAGFPRYITKDFDDTDAASYATDLYKINVLNETEDNSASGTLINDHNDCVIWFADGAYHCYSPDYNVSSANATICVYAFNADGNIIAYQTIAYPIG